MMVLLKFVLLIALCVEISLGQVTKRENKLLNRKKRYLTFPQGSNFVMTISGVKSLMMRVPKGINMLGECDVPFSLPSDTRLFRNYRRTHIRQRRQIFNQLSMALEGYGLNGNACVKRMICEAQDYIPLKGKSLVKDLLSATFNNVDELGQEYSNYCHNSTFLQCDVPLLNYLEGFALDNELT